MRKLHLTVVIVAAGNSGRMGRDKMTLQIAGIPVVLRTLNIFQACDAIDDIIVVAKKDACDELRKLCAEKNITKLKNVVAGGETRTDSVYNGVFASSKKTDLIAVHDGARPLVTDALIRAVAEKAAKYNAAIPAVRVKPTLKRVRNGVIQETVPRDDIYEAQTPQIFDADLLKAALTKAFPGATDEASLVEALGATVYIVEGSYDNIKITTAEDVAVAEAILAARAAEGA